MVDSAAAVASTTPWWLGRSAGIPLRLPVSSRRYLWPMPVPGSLPFDPIEEAQRQWTAHGWGAQAGAMAVVTSLTAVVQLLLAPVDDALQPFRLTLARFESTLPLAFAD